MQKQFRFGEGKLGECVSTMLICLNFVRTCEQVTFRDPDSVRMACMDPYPVIDGRRANCNLAILWRPGPAVPFGQSLTWFSIAPITTF